MDFSFIQYSVLLKEKSSGFWDSQDYSKAKLVHRLTPKKWTASGWRALRGLFFFIPPEFVLLFKIIKQLSLPEKKANYPSRWHCPSTFRHAGGVAAAWVHSQQGEASGSAPRCCWERSSNPKPAEPGCLPPLPKGSASNIEMLIWLCKPINKNKEEDTRGKKPPWTPCPNPISSIQALSDGVGFCPQEWVPQVWYRNCSKGASLLSDVFKWPLPNTGIPFVSEISENSFLLQQQPRHKSASLTYCPFTTDTIKY